MFTQSPRSRRSGAHPGRAIEDAGQAARRQVAGRAAHLLAVEGDAGRGLLISGHHGEGRQVASRSVKQRHTWAQAAMKLAPKPRGPWRSPEVGGRRCLLGHESPAGQPVEEVGGSALLKRHTREGSRVQVLLQIAGEVADHDRERVAGQRRERKEPGGCDNITCDSTRCGVSRDVRCCGARRYAPGTCSGDSTMSARPLRDTLRVAAFRTLALSSCTSYLITAFLAYASARARVRGCKMFGSVKAAEVEQATARTATTLKRAISAAGGGYPAKYPCCTCADENLAKVYDARQ